MSLEEKNIYNIANEILEEKNFFMVDFIFRGNPNERIIEIFVDSEKNVTAEDLAEINRLINTKIEENNLLSSGYRLDVSSPGTERPLIFLKQFPKHINRKFDVSYKLNDETKKLSGKLVRVEGENLFFLSNQNEISINFNNIKKAKVIVSFS
jgi:ribosome maturation factor RimP